MKIVKSDNMVRLLNKGIKLAKKHKKPKNGTIYSLFTKQSKNGWDYQIDYIYDKRIRENPFVAVHGFKPPRTQDAVSADIVLSKELI